MKFYIVEFVGAFFGVYIFSGAVALAFFNRSKEFKRTFFPPAIVFIFTIITSPYGLAATGEEPEFLHAFVLYGSATIAVILVNNPFKKRKEDTQALTNSKKVVFGARIFIFLFLGLVIPLIYLKVVSVGPSRNHSKIPTIVQESYEVRKNLPVMLDEATRFDDIFFDGWNINYKYTIIGIKRDDYDVKETSNNFYEILKKKFCSDPDVLIFLTEGRSIFWTYADMEGKIFSVELNQSGCSLKKQ